MKDASDETQDDKQGKMLLHTEHSLLSFLNGQPGIIREHGLFEVSSLILRYFIFTEISDCFYINSYKNLT